MRIAVTGGIGSGKSLVVDKLEELGAVVYRADVRAKELVYIPKIKQQIVDLLGALSFQNGTYNTSFVASKVFADKLLLEALNQIIHPAVFEDLDIFCEKNHGKTIVYESALLIETNHTHLFDKIILITAPVDIKIERVIKRDRITREEVLKRMERQWSDDEKIQFADIIIENIDKRKTLQKVEKLWHLNFNKND